MTDITKHCLFCREREDLEELYPRTFRDEDLTPGVFSARRVTEHFHYRMVRCRHCGLVFSREILPGETLRRLYAESTVTFSRYADIIAADYWRALEPFMAPGRRGKALEVGCSSGFFLETLLKAGFREVAGVEPSREAIGRAAPRVRDAIVPGFFREGMFPEESFDLVCSFQTLDHLEEPLEVLRGLRRLLRPGGTGYFITHNVRAFQARALGEKSPIIDVEHIYLFDRRTLRRALEETGYVETAVGSLRNSYPAGYWLRMFPMRPAIRDRLLAWAGRTGLDGWPLPIRAGNIFAVGRRGGGA
ncbi:MAG: class I SAM-dependent methyltransferase [Bacteroidota bacterium]